MKRKPLSVGDYVLVTKFSDGDPKDPFYIGFFAGMDDNRYIISDPACPGISFRRWWRCDRISKRVGDVLCKHIKVIEEASASVWYWRRNIKSLEKVAKIINREK